MRYDVITPVHEVTCKVLLDDPNYIAGAVMWPSISMTEITLAFLWQKLSQPQFYNDLTKKITFWGTVRFRFRFNNLQLVLGMALQFYTSVEKGSKLKVRMFCGLISKFGEITGKNLVSMGVGWGASLLPSSHSQLG